MRAASAEAEPASRGAWWDGGATCGARGAASAALGSACATWAAEARRVPRLLLRRRGLGTGLGVLCVLVRGAACEESAGGGGARLPSWTWGRSGRVASGLSGGSCQWEMEGEGM